MRRPKPQNLWHVLQETFANWSEHAATTHWGRAVRVATIQVPLESTSSSSSASKG